MNKYSILKSFERKLTYPIWKIEVDSINNQLAFESRNPENTNPYFSVIDFNGNVLLNDLQIDVKEWTLAGVQKGCLILKKYGASAPIQAGVRIINILTSADICTYQEYVFEEIYDQYVKVNHRSIPSGMPFYINIENGSIHNSKDLQKLELPESLLQLPETFKGKLPTFIAAVPYIEQIWIQPYKDYFLWAYHVKNGSKYNLIVSLSSKNKILTEKIILTDLDQLIPQPYFAVKEHIFFLSSNKMEIEAYLVLL